MTTFRLSRAAAAEAAEGDMVYVFFLCSYQVEVEEARNYAYISTTSRIEGVFCCGVNFALCFVFQNFCGGSWVRHAPN